MVDLKGPVLAVCLAHMPFFVVSAISSKATWGKGHPSTKWSKPPHLKHLWAGGLDCCSVEDGCHQCLVCGGEWAAMMSTHCLEPDVIHPDYRPVKLFVLLHDKVPVIGLVQNIFEGKHTPGPVHTEARQINRYPGN